MAEPWLTKREIAREFGVSTRTVERQGWPYIPVGGQNRYLRTRVEAFLLGVADDGGDVIAFPGNRAGRAA